MDIERAQEFIKNPLEHPLTRGEQMEIAQAFVSYRNFVNELRGFLPSDDNPTRADYENVQERLFGDGCCGLIHHVREYILEIGREVLELRTELITEGVRYEPQKTRPDPI